MKGLLFRSCFALPPVILSWLLYMPAVDAAEGEAELEISPRKIEVNSFYHGTDIELKGTVAEGCAVALVLMGKEEEHTLRRKGRVGPLWMNVETVFVKGAPQMYYLLTSAETLEELASAEDLAKRDIGYEALRKSVVIEQENSDYNATFREFVKLKESMGLYNAVYGSIKLRPMNENVSQFVAALPIPPLVPPGECEVLMHCFKENQPISNTAVTLMVEKVGLPAKLSTLAFSHGAMYGILAIVIAIAAGLFMGFLFGKKEKGGK